MFNYCLITLTIIIMYTYHEIMIVESLDYYIISHFIVCLVSQTTNCGETVFEFLMNATSFW